MSKDITEYNGNLSANLYHEVQKILQLARQTAYKAVNFAMVSAPIGR